MEAKKLLLRELRPGGWHRRGKMRRRAKGDLISSISQDPNKQYELRLLLGELIKSGEIVEDPRDAGIVMLAKRQKVSEGHQHMLAA